MTQAQNTTHGRAPASSTVIAWLAFATMFVIGTDTFLVAPMLPTLADEFDVSTSTSGWMVSAYALGFALFALVAGPLSDGRDRRGVLLLGFAGFAVATALCGVAQGLWTMILFRFLAGMFAALCTPQIWASIPVLVAPEAIMKTMGIAGAGMSISQVVGVPVGGWLAASSWHVPFFVVAALSGVAWLLLWKAFPSVPSARAQGAATGIVGTYAELFRSKTFTWYLLAYLAYQTGVFETISFIGSWLHKDFDLGVSAVGAAMMALGVGMAITSIFGNRLIRKIGEHRTLAVVFTGLIVIYSAVPFAPNLGLAIAGLAAGSAVLGLGYPIFMAMLLAQTTAARGTVSSLSTTALYAGTTIGGLVGGVLLTEFDGFRGVAGFTVLALAVSAVIFGAAGAFRAPKPAGATEGAPTEAEPTAA
ncbi:MFS transporter [Streptomyces botrytidirepellens]|uniref:MFS transporter n=1 Tax=Streptomyces botrytidirepellens TaxID=2486417 RepID=A0A3M8VZ36_9ACTN|nr:MFS transporter [Streptomyces botrytidirepellens]RNG22590.1 MFS transporter [Streptomyces botrytidirepellens]